MKVFEVGHSFQRHCVVCDDISEVADLWEKEYGLRPKEISLVSEYVILKGGNND